MLLRTGGATGLGAGSGAVPPVVIGLGAVCVKFGCGWPAKAPRVGTGWVGFSAGLGGNSNAVFKDRPKAKGVIYRAFFVEEHTGDTVLFFFAVAKYQRIPRCYNWKDFMGPIVPDFVAHLYQTSGRECDRKFFPSAAKDHISRRTQT